MSHLPPPRHTNFHQHSVLVPANPYLTEEIPKWLYIYSRAPQESDHKLKWKPLQASRAGVLPGHPESAAPAGAGGGRHELRGGAPGHSQGDGAAPCT
ncbi:hypothetical protein MTO96_027833 [Rhipicephalus appendiculatus]